MSTGTPGRESPGGHPDPWAGHPIIDRAEAELRAFVGDVDRGTAARFLVAWKHYPELTAREVSAVLERFPARTLDDMGPDEVSP